MDSIITFFLLICIIIYEYFSDTNVPKHDVQNHINNHCTNNAGISSSPIENESEFLTCKNSHPDVPTDNAPISLQKSSELNLPANCQPSTENFSSESKKILENYSTQEHILNDVKTKTSNSLELSKSVTYPQELNKIKNDNNDTNVKQNEKSFHRPSLVEDSKLVKIPLPTNPINLMQSNAQFLNKSRNFLNFITEKSTNIMEKTLLPQHIANKYGTVNKNVEADSKTSLELTSDKNKLRQSSLPNSPARITAENENENNVYSSVITYNPKQEDIIISDRSSNASQNDLSVSSSSEAANNILFEDSDELRQNPMFMTLIRDHTALKNENMRFLERIRQLEEKNQAFEVDKNELYMTKIKPLEKSIEKLTTDLKMSTLNQEAMSKELVANNKEKESMVMKYAIGEKLVIEAQR